MWINSFPRYFADVLAVIFAITATIDMAGFFYIRARARQWRYLRQFYQVMCVLQLFTALFLAVPQLRIWGIILAGLVTSFRTVILRYHRQWNWAAASTRSAPILLPPSRLVPKFPSLHEGGTPRARDGRVEPGLHRPSLEQSDFAPWTIAKR
jgi:hypothetical protein